MANGIYFALILDELAFRGKPDETSNHGII